MTALNLQIWPALGKFRPVGMDDTGETALYGPLCPTVEVAAAYFRDVWECTESDWRLVSREELGLPTDAQWGKR